MLPKVVTLLELVIDLSVELAFRIKISQCWQASKDKRTTIGVRGRHQVEDCPLWKEECTTCLRLEVVTLTQGSFKVKPQPKCLQINSSLTALRASLSRFKKREVQRQLEEKPREPILLGSTVDRIRKRTSKVGLPLTRYWMSKMTRVRELRNQIWSFSRWL